MMEKSIEKYSALVSKRPLAILAVLIAASAIFIYGATKVDTVSQETKDFLPESIASVEAYDTISQEFGSTESTSYTVLVQTSPDYAGSNEVRDIRDPRVLHYLRSASNDIEKDEYISTVRSADDLFPQVPGSLKKVKAGLDRIGSETWNGYISKDFTSTKVEITAYDVSDEKQNDLADRIRKIFRIHDKPPGLEISYTGQTYIDQAFESVTRNTMAVTSLVSVVGVILIVIFLFRSVYDGFTSLLALIFGVITGYGIFGYLGFNMTPSTSGAISIGIGIAIDFGIQTVSRYREEIEEVEIQEAVANTLKSVSKPMTIALVSAVIGFTTLSMGRLTFLSDLGTVLTLTTVSAYIGSFTVVPVFLVLYDKHIKNRFGNGGENNG